MHLMQSLPATPTLKRNLKAYLNESPMAGAHMIDQKFEPFYNLLWHCVKGFSFKVNSKFL